MIALLGRVLAAFTGPLVNVHIEHVGTVRYLVDDHDEHHDCCLDPDEPVNTARLMDDDEMFAFGRIVGHHFSDDLDAIRVACDTAMATLALEEAAYRLEGEG